MRSSFHGYIVEIPFILVDNFETKHKSAYFLSHYHNDHLVGLNSPDFPQKLKENNGFIYTSEVTVAIIKNDLPLLTPYLKSLKLGSNTVTIKENDKEIFLSVTTLPAGHSLGSIMFLFKYNHTILYTGDFRITPNTLTRFTHLHDQNGVIKIDALYLDTTFQDIPSFPKRSDVVRNIVIHIKDWLTVNIQNTVQILTSAGYGYEFLCNEIFDSTKIKTFLGAGKWNVFRQFPKEMYGITNDNTSRIHMQTKYEPTPETSSKTLTVYLSAQKWGKCAGENFLNIKKTKISNSIEACFATHCGRDEMLHFVDYLRPKKVVGFPNEFKNHRALDMVLPDSEILPNFDGSLKRPRRFSECEKPVVKKISKCDVESLFEW